MCALPLCVYGLFFKEKNSKKNTIAQFLTAVNIYYPTVTTMLLTASNYFEGSKSLSAVIFSDEHKLFPRLADM